MIGLAKYMVISVWVGLVCAVIAIGLAGLLTGVPLAFLDYLPGDNLTARQNLPRILLTAGLAGLAIGTLATAGCWLSSHRLGYLTSAMVVTLFAAAAVLFTHPRWTLDPQAGFFDYLESYRLIILSCLVGVLTLGVAGRLLPKPARSSAGD